MTPTERPATSSATPARARMLCVSLVFCMGLAACGGGNETGTADAGVGNPALSRAAEDAPVDAAVSAISPSDQALIAQGARLSSTELLAAEQQAEAPDAAVPKSDYASGQVVAKALATRIPVYRFYNGSTGAHFFTTSVAERNHVQANLSPPFSFEGVAFSVASAFSPGLSPVHRFFNTQSGVHFYTISESERAHIVATMPQFRYEGVAYHASQVAGAGLVPFYRFYVPSRGFHFYTANTAERDSIIANLGGTYSYEGVGYHVLDGNWRAEKLPHTGVTSSQCFQAGTDTLVACGNTAAMNLNPLQDGHLRNVNTPSYSRVPIAGTNSVYSETECIRDNVTGLIWEGKEANGQPRAGNLTFTNLGDGIAFDVSGYVPMVNTMGLCGFSDWRMPTMLELLTLANFGQASGAMVSSIAFPNTPVASETWSSEPYVGGGGVWAFSFNAAEILRTRVTSRTEFRPVRLVRGGNQPAGVRFSYSTVPYHTDSPNNAVNDAWTGLQWRRCLEGAVWNGLTCSGTPASFTQENAMAHARQQSGWRMPNVKEAASLFELWRINVLDPVAFPGTGEFMWTTTPYVGSSSGAYVIHGSTGQIRATSPRSQVLKLRLVRHQP